MPVREKAAAVIILVDSAFRKHNWGCLFINEEKWFPAGFLSLLNLWAVCMFWAKACCLSQNILFWARHWVTDQLCLISSEKCIFRFTQLYFRVASLLIFVNLTWNELYGTLRDWAASSSTSSVIWVSAKLISCTPHSTCPFKNIYSRISALWRHAVNLKHNNITNITV